MYILQTANELALDCIARMKVEAHQSSPKLESHHDFDSLEVKSATVEDLINGSETDARENSRAARRRNIDQSYDYTKLAEAHRQLRQVEVDIHGKDWTIKLVRQLAQCLMGVRETLRCTQNKAAEIEIGAALHRHIVSAVQCAESLEGGTDDERVTRIRASGALRACLKNTDEHTIAMNRTNNEVGQADIEAWVLKRQQTRSLHTNQVLVATRALDVSMRAEVEALMRDEREVDSVEDLMVDKEEFVSKLSQIRQRTLDEQQGLELDQHRVEHVRCQLESLYQEREVEAEQALLNVRTQKGACLDRLEKYKDQLVAVLGKIKHEHSTMNEFAQEEEHILNIQKENTRVHASTVATLLDLKQGQRLLLEDVNAKQKALDLVCCVYLWIFYKYTC